MHGPRFDSHSGTPSPVLYIHPNSQMWLDEILPISVPALMNRIHVPIRGRFQNELSVEEIRSARVAILDIHWYLTLPAALRLSYQLKERNPELVIIAGGLTASIFAKQIVETSAIDFVIRGDAEVPLPALVHTLVDGGDVDRIPNLQHREFATEWSFVLTKEILDELDYNRFDFFPTFKRRILSWHARKTRRPFFTHPWCMAFRGCPISCQHCVGAYESQKALFRRGPVWRSAHVLQEELAKLSLDPNMQYVNFMHDVISLASQDYSKQVFSQAYDLNLYYELARLPSEESLDHLFVLVKQTHQ